MPLNRLPRISFCTTCMGRLEHLKQTLPQNIEDNADYPNSQFVVVNYGGEKDTEEWIRETFPDEIASGKLKYVSYPAAKHFRFAHAKNIAHRMADGDIVCNIDADQYTGRYFAQLIADTFVEAEKGSKRVFMRHNPLEVGINHGSSGGKIALLKTDFDALRGYDEEKRGWTGDDAELNGRMIFRRMHRETIPLTFANGIEHPDDMRISMLDEESSNASKAYLRQVRGAKTQLGMYAGKACRLVGHMAGAIVRKTNPDGYGMGDVYVNFADTAIHLGNMVPVASLTGKTANIG